MSWSTKVRNLFGGGLSSKQTTVAWVVALGAGIGWYSWEHRRNADTVIKYDGSQGAFTEKETNAWNQKVAANNPKSFHSSEAKEAHARAEQIQREKRERIQEKRT